MRSFLFGVASLPLVVAAFGCSSAITVPSGAECTGNQVPNADDTACVDPKPHPTQDQCAAEGKVLASDGASCVDRAKHPSASECAAEGKVLSTDGTACVDAPKKNPTAAECAAEGKVLSTDGTACVDAPKKNPTAAECAALGQILNADGTACIAAPHVTEADCGAQGKVVTSNHQQCVAPSSFEYSFIGGFDAATLGFGADTADALFAECTASASTWASPAVAKMTVGGTAYANLTDHWASSTTCAVAVLNATRKGGAAPILTALVSGLPIAIVAQYTDEIDAVLNTYLPKVVLSDVGGLSVNGTSYSAYETQWAPADVLSMLRYGVLRNDGTLGASGKIQGAPFAFSGATAQDVYDECSDYLGHSSAFTTHINTIFVNGQNEAFVPGYISVDKACTTIANDAGTMQ